VFSVDVCQRVCDLYFSFIGSTDLPTNTVKHLEQKKALQHYIFNINTIIILTI